VISDTAKGGSRHRLAAIGLVAVGLIAIGLATTYRHL